ncbi:hypothetical protein Dimus_037286, partial [Dionaea muscipula]
MGARGRPRKLAGKGREEVVEPVGQDDASQCVGDHLYQMAIEEQGVVGTIVNPVLGAGPIEGEESRRSLCSDPGRKSNLKWGDEDVG